MALAMAFGGLALFPAATGIYGVPAYPVTQRRREIGIRGAPGSTAGGVVRLILREGLLPAGIGLSLGAGAAIALRQVANELYGVSALDPAALAAVVALLAAVALVAWAGPARGATKVNPVIVLSEDWPAHPVRVEATGADRKFGSGDRLGPQDGGGRLGGRAGLTGTALPLPRPLASEPDGPARGRARPKVLPIAAAD